MERVALAHVVNEEIRRLAAARFEVPRDRADVGWFCHCGCFTLVNATLDQYDARGGRIFAEGHPVDDARVAAADDFERLDPSAVLAQLDEELRRSLTEELARRLERQELARRVEGVLKDTGDH